MKNKVSKLIALGSLSLCLTLAPGCASYTHTRTAGGVTETTSVSTLLMFGSAGPIDSRTSDTNYNHTLSVGNVNGGVDKTLNQIVAAGVAAYLQGKMPAK